MVSIPACRVGDPGSIPGLGVFYFFEAREMVVLRIINSEVHIPIIEKLKLLHFQS